MHKLLVTPDEVRDAGSAPDHREGFVWMDAEGPDSGPVADAGAVERVATPTLVPVFEPTHNGLEMVMHSLDREGHLIQLGVVVGDRRVFTFHSKFNAAVSSASLTKETDALARKLGDGSLKVSSPIELVAALMREVASTLEELLGAAAGSSGKLDRRIRDERIKDQQKVLEELFEVRRDLFTIRNRAAQTLEVAGAAARRHPDEFAEVVAYLERLLRMCDGERDFFQGVLDYYEQRVNVKINFATERLALIAALVLPLTAVSGILGMNTIVNDRTNVALTVVMLTFMVSMMGVLLYWSKKNDWW